MLRRSNAIRAWLRRTPFGPRWQAQSDGVEMSPGGARGGWTLSATALVTSSLWRHTRVLLTAAAVRLFRAHIAGDAIEFAAVLHQHSRGQHGEGALRPSAQARAAAPSSPAFVTAPCAISSSEAVTIKQYLLMGATLTSRARA
jgi:hypothetical protein